jgi:selT/selW/selH-like putative selenoprotein
VQPELIAGGGGIFDVKADGKLIFSKHETGRFPEHDEVLTALEKMNRSGAR